MTKPDELPPPDLIDAGGRMRRLVIAFVIGAVAAGTAYMIANGLAQPEQMPGGFDGGSQSRAFRFVFYMTGLAFGGAFGLSLAILNALERRRYKKSLSIPHAQVRK